VARSSRHNPRPPRNQALAHLERALTDDTIARDPVQSPSSIAVIILAYPDELDHAHPGAAASLREGMEETLTVIRLGITGKLKHTLQSTNPIESMISTVRVIHRNVKHWSSGEMCLRWTAAGMLEAEGRFRKCRATAASPRSRSRSNRTSFAAARVSFTPEPRRTLRHSLCNHDNRGLAVTKVPRRVGQPPTTGSDPRAWGTGVCLPRGAE
jgi:hypothetical protein